MAEGHAIDTSVGPIGGQALPEGVMMRRGQSWGAAVRRTDGTISVTSRVLPAGLAPWRRLPLLRGVLALGETAALGTKATVWAAQERGGESGDEYKRGGLFLTVVVAIVGVIGIFGLLPAVIVKALGVDQPMLFSLAEGCIRLGILVGYLGLLGRSKQVQRVFAYHGAEHMTIHAFEHRVDLAPATIRQFDRRHPRCGTAFLLVVVIVTMFAHALVGHPGWGLLIASRILGLPVVAGVAYEAIRFAGRHQHQLVGRMLMAPGSWLQAITTAEPTDDMIEVAIAALEATIAAEPVAAAAALSASTATLASTTSTSAASTSGGPTAIGPISGGATAIEPTGASASGRSTATDSISTGPTAPGPISGGPTAIEPTGTSASGRSTATDSISTGPTALGSTGMAPTTNGPTASGPTATAPTAPGSSTTAEPIDAGGAHVQAGADAPLAVSGSRP